MGRGCAFVGFGRFPTTTGMQPVEYHRSCSKAPDIDMIHWFTGVHKRTAAFGSLDFFGGDKRNT
jgi:hypothetical protein